MIRSIILLICVLFPLLTQGFENNWFTKSLDYFNYKNCSYQEKSELVGKFYTCLNSKSSDNYSNYSKYLNNNNSSDSDCQNLQDLVTCFPVFINKNCLDNEEHQFYFVLREFFKIQSLYGCSNDIFFEKSNQSNSILHNHYYYNNKYQKISQQCFSNAILKLKYIWIVNWKDGVMNEYISDLTKCDESANSNQSKLVRNYVYYKWAIASVVLPGRHIFSSKAKLVKEHDENDLDNEYVLNNYKINQNYLNLLFNTKEKKHPLDLVSYNSKLNKLFLNNFAGNLRTKRSIRETIKSMDVQAENIFEKMKNFLEHPFSNNVQTKKIYTKSANLGKNNTKQDSKDNDEDDKNEKNKKDDDDKDGDDKDGPAKKLFKKVEFNPFEVFWRKTVPETFFDQVDKASKKEFKDLLKFFKKINKQNNQENESEEQRKEYEKERKELKREREQQKKEYEREREQQKKEYEREREQLMKEYEREREQLRKEYEKEREELEKEQPEKGKNNKNSTNTTEAPETTSPIVFITTTENSTSGSSNNPNNQSSTLVSTTKDTATSANFQQSTIKS